MIFYVKKKISYLLIDKKKNVIYNDNKIKKTHETYGYFMNYFFIKYEFLKIFMKCFHTKENKNKIINLYIYNALTYADA